MAIFVVHHGNKDLHRQECLCCWEESAKGRFCLSAPALLPALLRSVVCKVASLSKCDLEMEDESGGSAQIVLCLASEADLLETRWQVIDIQRTQAEVAANAKIKAAADGRGKGIMRVCGVKQIGITMGNAKKRFRERMDAPDVVKRDAGAK